MQTTGQFGGIGVEVTPENGLLRIVTSMDDTPASRAGIKAGDIITRLNGTRYRGFRWKIYVTRCAVPLTRRSC